MTEQVKFVSSPVSTTKPSRSFENEQKEEENQEDTLDTGNFSLMQHLNNPIGGPAAAPPTPVAIQINGVDTTPMSPSTFFRAKSSQMGTLSGSGSSSRPTFGFFRGPSPQSSFGGVGRVGIRVQETSPFALNLNAKQEQNQPYFDGPSPIIRQTPTNTQPFSSPFMIVENQRQQTAPFLIEISPMEIIFRDCLCGKHISSSISINNTNQFPIIAIAEIVGENQESSFSLSQNYWKLNSLDCAICEIVFKPLLPKDYQGKLVIYAIPALIANDLLSTTIIINPIQTSQISTRTLISLSGIAISQEISNDLKEKQQEQEGIDFETVCLGELKESSITVINTSKSTARPFIKLDERSEIGAFSVKSTLGTINPSQSMNLFVVFSPTRVGTFEATLNVIFAGKRCRAIRLKGSCEKPKWSVVLPSPLLEFGVVGPNEEGNKTFEIQNESKCPIHLFITQTIVQGSNLAKLRLSDSRIEIAPQSTKQVSARLEASSQAKKTETIPLSGNIFIESTRDVIVPEECLPKANIHISALIGCIDLELPEGLQEIKLIQKGTRRAMSRILLRNGGNSLLSISLHVQPSKYFNINPITTGIPPNSVLRAIVMLSTTQKPLRQQESSQHQVHGTLKISAFGTVCEIIDLFGEWQN